MKSNTYSGSKLKMDRSGVKRSAENSDVVRSDSKSELHKTESSSDSLDIEEKRARLSTSTLKLECSICLEEMNSERRISSTWCGHVFCTWCIHQAIVQNKKCPKCRRSLNGKKVHRIFLFGERRGNWFRWRHPAFRFSL